MKKILVLLSLVSTTALAKEFSIDVALQQCKNNPAIVSDMAITDCYQWRLNRGIKCLILNTNN